MSEKMPETQREFVAQNPAHEKPYIDFVIDDQDVMRHCLLSSLPGQS
jgi:hypothetical protein